MRITHCTPSLAGMLSRATLATLLLTAGCGDAPMPPGMANSTSDLLGRASAASVARLDLRDRQALQQELVDAILLHSPQVDRPLLAEQLRPEVLRYVVDVDTAALLGNNSRNALRDSLFVALMKTYLPVSASKAPVPDGDRSWDSLMEVRVVLEDRREMRNERALLIPGEHDSVPPTLVLPKATTTPQELQFGLRLAAMYARMWETGAKPRERVVLSASAKQEASTLRDDESSPLLDALRAAERLRIPGVAEGPSMPIAVERR